MRQLHPDSDEVDPAAAHGTAIRSRTDGRPWVLMNMVTSIDGATAVDGVSGGLGGPGDKDVFSAIRAVADVIIAAAGTMRAEDYGPPRTPPARQDERRARGQAPFPRLAAITSSLDLDPSSPLFTESVEAPLIYTVDTAPADRQAALADRAEIVTAGTDRVDLSTVIDDLAARGATIVLVEGGPGLNGQFVAEGLVDEINVSTAPSLVGGDSPRIAHGEPVSSPTGLSLAHLWEDDGFLFSRYTR